MFTRNNVITLTHDVLCNVSYLRHTLVLTHLQSEAPDFDVPDMKTIEILQICRQVSILPCKIIKGSLRC
jgi:hypothetical protein